MSLRTGIALVFGIFVAAGASAQDRTPYDRLKSCNAQATARKDLKPEEREKFRSECMEAGADRGNTGNDKQLTAQQERMKTCNAQAGQRQLKGDERQGFMSRCLKGENVANAPQRDNAQQGKMVSCNLDAAKKRLTGDARKKFMSECLSAGAGATKAGR